MLALHELLARLLDHVGLIERLLSPTPGLDTVLALLAAAVLYALRLGLYFVCPALVLALLGYATVTAVRPGRE